MTASTICFGLSGRVILITGAAQGIGEACARRLAREGAHLVLCDLDDGRGQALAKELAARYVHCDVGDASQVAALVGQAMAAHGRIDGLVNNAGMFRAADFLDISEADFDAVLRVNLKGAFLVAQACAREMVKTGGGAVVNMSSVNAVLAIPTIASYNMSKGGVNQLTRAMALALADQGVRVNAVAPGWIASSGFETYPPEVQQWAKTLKTKIPLQRFGTESEAAAAIVFLLSEGAAFITGVTLRIDGGVLNARPTWPLTPHKRSKAYNGFPLYAPPKFRVEE